jgi:LPS sulfotransferase NodH
VALQTDWLEWWVSRMQKASRRIDIDYRTLVADPVAAVVHIHDTLGLPLTEGHVRRMHSWLSENGQRRHGENPYRCEDFGQKTEEIAERFRAYRSRHGFDR